MRLRRSIELCALCVSCGGCRELIDADAYAVGRTAPDGARVPCACAERECADQLAACEADEVCSKLKACRDACSDPVCLRECSPLGPSAQYDALAQCRSTVCFAECQVGRDWSCVGRYWMKGQYGGRDLDISLRLVPGLLTPTFEGMLVRACGVDGIDCNVVRGELTMHLPGTAVFTVPGGSTGFLGHFFVQHAEIPPTFLRQNAPFLPIGTYVQREGDHLVIPAAPS